MTFQPFESSLYGSTSHQDDMKMRGCCSSLPTTTTTNEMLEECNPKKQTTCNNLQSCLEELQFPNLPTSTATNPAALKILFLSSDTGGGHRASAEALAQQFLRFYPNSTYTLLDILSDHGVPPYNSLVEAYKHFSSHPHQWKAFYKVTNTKIAELWTDVHMKLAGCENAIRERIKSYDPDVVISVHPLMNSLPSLSCHFISQETGKHLPMFTVVTDLGNCHKFWFAKQGGGIVGGGIENIFIASDQIRDVAVQEKHIPEHKLLKLGLPIRHDFAQRAEALGDRWTEMGRRYQKAVRKHMGLADCKTVLAMGGGEGVGSLSQIVNALFLEMVDWGVEDVTILVVCGRNQTLKQELEETDWDHISNDIVAEKGLFGLGVIADSIKNFISSNRPSALRHIMNDFNRSPSLVVTDSDDDSDNDDDIDDDKEQYNKCKTTPTHPYYTSKSHTNVKVIPLGFIKNMSEYMVASDILITKAGPGTIAEAAAVGLPVMITSFLPGQEEGNVDFVLQKQFGAFQMCPNKIAMEVRKWLSDDELLKQMSQKAKEAGNPRAAEEIVRWIGKSTVRWKELNEHEL